MKVRCVCFLLDLSGREANNGKSVRETVRQCLMSIIAKFEPGDMVFVNDGDEIEGFDDMGQLYGAIGNWDLTRPFHLSNVLKDMIDVSHIVDGDEDVFFFVITDRYDKKSSHALRRVVGREPSLNIFNKPSAFYFYGISPCDPLEIEDAHPHCASAMFDDAAELEPVHFTKILFASNSTI